MRVLLLSYHLILTFDADVAPRRLGGLAAVTHRSMGLMDRH